LGVYPLRIPQHLVKGTIIYRNLDVAFEKLLSDNKTQRLITININVDTGDSANSLTITLTDNDVQTKIERTIDCEVAIDSALSKQNIIKQMSKMGQTPFVVAEIVVIEQVATMSYAVSSFNALRREAIDAHIKNRFVTFLSLKNLNGIRHKYNILKSICSEMEM